MQYRNQKMTLELAHRQLNAHDSTTEMLLIRHGSVKTQPFSDANAMPVDQYVQQELTRQGLH